MTAFNNYIWLCKIHFLFFQDTDDKAKNKNQKDSRFKDAKKIQKKNFKVNSKKVFNEDGEVRISKNALLSVIKSCEN